MLQQPINSKTSKTSEIFDSLPVSIQKILLNANDDRFNPVFAPMSFYVFYNALVEDHFDPRGVLVMHLTREGFLHYKFISHSMAYDYGLLSSMYMNIALKPRSYFEFLNLFFFTLDTPLHFLKLSIEPTDFDLSLFEGAKGDDALQHLCADTSKVIFNRISGFVDSYTRVADKLECLTTYHYFIRNELSALFGYVHGLQFK